MSNSVTFGSTNLSTYGLVLPSYEIPAPEPYLYLEEVAGRNGLVDLSNAFGSVRYKNRDWLLEFKNPDPTVNWHTLSTNVMTLLHGKRLDFVFDDDPNFVWNGRISVQHLISDHGEITLPIAISSDPYKLKSADTVVTETITGSGTVTLTNLNKEVVPVITTTRAMVLSFEIDGTTYTATVDGTATVPQLVLKEGNTVVTVNAGGVLDDDEYIGFTGTITFTYREGTL